MQLKNYKETLKEDSAYKQLFKDFIIDFFKKVDRTANILEIGSGAGYFLKDMLSLGFKNLYSIDTDNFLLQEVNDCVTFCGINISFNSIPYASNYFDYVVSIQVIEHVENPWNFMREITRVQSEQGKLLISFPTSKDIFSRIKFLFEGNVYSFTKENNHISFFTNDVQEKLFINYKIVKEVYTKAPITMLRIYFFRKIIRDIFKIKFFPLRKIFSMKTLFIMEKLKRKQYYNHKI